MTEYSNINAKLSDSQLDKLKSAAKIATAVTPTLTAVRSGMKGINETSFPHNILPTDRQVKTLQKDLQIVHQIIKDLDELTN